MNLLDYLKSASSSEQLVYLLTASALIVPGLDYLITTGSFDFEQIDFLTILLLSIFYSVPIFFLGILTATSIINTGEEFKNPETSREVLLLSSLYVLLTYIAYHALSFIMGTYKIQTYYGVCLVVMVLSIPLDLLTKRKEK